MKKRSKLPLLVLGTVLLAGAATSATAQASTPCGPSFFHSSGGHGLTPVSSGSLIYDSNEGLCWLADANLAGHPEVRAAVTLSPANPDGTTPFINPDGTMDYETALNWVSALNSFNGGKGWLNHSNWQLPSNPASGTTCTSINVDNFAAECTGSAMGNLYKVGLAQTYPDSVVPYFLNWVWPFFNLQPGLYWTSDPGPQTFSFNSGLHGSNTTKYNFLHVLPMTTAVLGPLPPGKGVQPYLSGPGAGRAVYDSNTGISWTLNANLPAFYNFGFRATTTITSDVNPSVLTLPMINKDGAVYFSAIDPANTKSGWIVSMNNSKYAGTSTWALPSLKNMNDLYSDMVISAGDTRLAWPFFVGPHWRLQPGFYWGCVRQTKTGPNGPCDYSQDAPTPVGNATPLGMELQAVHAQRHFFGRD